MNKVDFEGYTLSIKQLIGYCKHFGFDDDDTQAVLSYCKNAQKYGFISEEEISSIVSYKDGIQMIPSSVFVSARLNVKTSELLTGSIEQILERAIIAFGESNLICPDQSGKFTRIAVSNLTRAKASIHTLPLLDRVILSIRGDVGLIAYYNDENADKYKTDMIERGVIPLSESGFKLSGRFGLPLKV